MEFWARLDQLLATHEIIIDRPLGSHHPMYPEITFPFDYGHLKGTSGGDGNEIDACLGTLNKKELVAIICTVDSWKHDTEVKLLVDCAEE